MAPPSYTHTPKRSKLSPDDDSQTQTSGSHINFNTNQYGLAYPSLSEPLSSYVDFLEHDPLWHPSSSQIEFPGIDGLLQSSVYPTIPTGTYDMAHDIFDNSLFQGTTINKNDPQPHSTIIPEMGHDQDDIPRLLLGHAKPNIESNTFMDNPIEKHHPSAITNHTTKTISFQCEWKGCAYEGKFKHKRALMRHVESLHVSPGLYECHTAGCGRKYNRKDNLAEHQRRLGH
ncbi:hypothetical protein BGW36DRAFT_377256 [Talaromyces proteolyticus]|uniref:C2H2-type domain-containing protein n=1 Tax=Talaromyces proteolyticus TaxID=1131652 RepID=A0AAD4KS02_9EURO|nr:uncharacterized protein BGW36DRAFT_377256 [Talaromyces proteolyticus]KAH8699079.1 hypothetical protein BGW36DRAFT_377256 [Talaromyces proteolyticus]